MRLGNDLPASAIGLDRGFPESGVGKGGLDAGGKCGPFALKGYCNARVVFPRIAVGCGGFFYDSDGTGISSTFSLVRIGKGGAGDGKERE